VRTAPKPLHPRGTTWSGDFVRSGDGRSGVHWLDTPGTDRAVVRVSRAAGLPAGWPDVHGLALRILDADDGGTADLLLATTGSGPLGRFVLHPGRRPEQMFFGSLLPYRTAIGPVSFGALPRDDVSWDMLWARGRSPWTPFARLMLWERTPDEATSFDPVLNQPPGFAQYDTVARLRLPAYRRARRTRSDSIAEADSGTSSP